MSDFFNNMSCGKCEEEFEEQHEIAKRTRLVICWKCKNFGIVRTSSKLSYWWEDVKWRVGRLFHKEGIE